MQSTTILLGILPLIIFVVIDSFSGLKSALIGATIMAIAELIFSLISFGEIDMVTWASFILVLALAALSFHSQTDRWIKLQPVILGFIIGSGLLISSFFDQPFLYTFALKYQSVFPQLQEQFANPFYHHFYKRLNDVSAIAILLHAALVYWAAIRLSNWWWLLIRGLGTYLFLFLAFIITSLSFF